MKPYVFAAEYAKSGQASCKGCKEKIAKGALRVGVISIGGEQLQYSGFETRYPNVIGPVAVTTQQDMDDCEQLFDQMGWLWRWYHVDCFNFHKYPALKDTSCFCVKSPFESLSAADQAAIAAKIGAGGGPAPKAKGKAKGKAKAEPKLAATRPAPKAKLAATRPEPKAAAAAPKAVAGLKRKASAIENDLQGKSVCFTGTLSMTRAQAQNAAKGAGARVVGDVSKSTNIVVCGADAGSKQSKAISFGLTVWDEATFKAACGL